MTGALLSLAAGFLLFFVLLLILERNSELRRFWLSRTVTAFVVGILIWKLTPVWTRYDDVFSNPMILLSFNSGLPGVFGGVSAFVSIVALSLWQVGKERPGARRWPLGVPVLAALALVGLWTVLEPIVVPRPGSDPGSAVLALVPDFEGRTHALADWKGKVVVINFWATWCPPCLAELPEFQTFTQKTNKVVVLGINMITTEKNGIASVIRFTSEKKMRWTQLTDPEGTLQKAFAVTSIPTTVVLDPDGRVVDRQEGPVALSWLRGLEGRFVR